MFWQLEGFFNFDKIGYVRNYPHKFPETRDVDGEERIRRTDSFIIEVFGRIVGNAFKVNSIPFDIVSYLEDSAHSKVKDEYGVVPPEIRKHVPRCLTNSKYDASVAW